MTVADHPARSMQCRHLSRNFAHCLILQETKEQLLGSTTMFPNGVYLLPSWQTPRALSLMSGCYWRRRLPLAAADFRHPCHRHAIQFYDAVSRGLAGNRHASHQDVEHRCQHEAK